MSRRSWLLAAAALLGGLAMACSGPGGGGATPSPSSSATVQPLPRATGASGPRNGLTAATLDLEAGAVHLRVAASNLGGTLYQVTSDGGAAPEVDLRGSRLSVSGSLSGNNQPNPRDIDVELNQAVRWTLNLNGGATTEDVLMGPARVDSVALTAGANEMTVALGLPHGAVDVRVTGGANQLVFRIPAQASASLQLTGAANAVTIDGQDRGRVAGGATFEVGAGGSDRYQIDLLAGLNRLTLTRG